MSDTPETDKAESMAFSGEYMVPTEFARELERERDEAREQWKQQNEALITLALHGDAEIQRLTKERDDARARVEIITPNENNPVAKFFSSSNTPETDAFSVEFKTVCGSKKWVPVDLSRRLERERDEARKQLVRSNHFLHQAEENLESIYRERDEAREDAEYYRERYNQLKDELKS